MSKIERLDNAAKDLARKIALQEANQTYLERRLRETRSAKANPLLFWKVFTPEQKQLRADVQRLGRELSETITRLANDEKALSNARTDASTARKRLSDHENFNLN